MFLFTILKDGLEKYYEKQFFQFAQKILVPQVVYIIIHTLRWLKTLLTSQQTVQVKDVTDHR